MVQDINQFESLDIECIRNEEEETITDKQQITDRLGRHYKKLATMLVDLGAFETFKPIIKHADCCDLLDKDITPE